MILQYGYTSNGFKPQTILGLGFMLRRNGTDSSVVIVEGPFRSVAGQAWSPGSQQGQGYTAGSVASQAHSPGSEEGQAWS